MKNYMDLTGKIALITGASSGIGAATAHVFADLGAKVAIGYHGNQAGAERVRVDIERAGGKAIAIRADVRKGSDIHMLVNSVTEQLGPIDILVNNAGSLVERQRILEVTEERWNDIMALNLTSAVLCSQAVAAGHDRAQEWSDYQYRLDRRTQRRRSGSGRIRDGEGRADYAHKVAGEGTGSAWGSGERCFARRNRDAVSRSLLDAGDDQELCGGDSDGPHGNFGGMRDGDRISGVGAAAYVAGETIEVNGGQLML